MNIVDNYNHKDILSDEEDRGEDIETNIKSIIRDVHDFPKPGILFKDITPLLQHQKLCTSIVAEFIDRLSLQKIDAIVGIESRGFLFGMMLANKMNIPLILIRKQGKLPYATIKYSYDLEYGSAQMELQIGDIKPNWNVLIHDDVLATGGTADAAAQLIKMQKGNIAGYAFLVELGFLKGQEKINHHSQNIISLVKYD